MNAGAPRETEGFDIVVNGVDRFFAQLEVSAIACAGFHKESYPGDTVQMRTRADHKLRTVLGYARLE